MKTNAEIDSDFDRTDHYFDKEKSMGIPQTSNQNPNAPIPTYQQDEEDIQAVFKSINLANQQNSHQWQQEAEQIKKELMQERQEALSANQGSLNFDITKSNNGTAMGSLNFDLTQTNKSKFL